MRPLIASESQIVHGTFLSGLFKYTILGLVPWVMPAAGSGGSVRHSVEGGDSLTMAPPKYPVTRFFYRISDGAWLRRMDTGSSMRIEEAALHASAEYRFPVGVVEVRDIEYNEVHEQLAPAGHWGGYLQPDPLSITTHLNAFTHPNNLPLQPRETANASEAERLPVTEN